MKKEKEQICRVCGGKSFVSTTEGIMCKNCKYILSSFAPMPLKEKKD